MLSNRPLNPEKSKMSPLQAWVILEQAAGVAVCTLVSEPTLTHEKNIGRPGHRRPDDSQSVGVGGWLPLRFYSSAQVPPPLDLQPMVKPQTVF